MARFCFIFHDWELVASDRVWYYNEGKTLLLYQCKKCDKTYLKSIPGIFILASETKKLENYKIHCEVLNILAED